MPSTADKGLFDPVYRANDWLKTRLANIDLFDEHYQREAVTNPFYALGSIFYLVWFLVMLTGVILIMWYIPTKAGAFDSILRIQNHVPLGNIMRGMHKYGADAMIIAATMRLFRIFLAGDYKPGKEFNAAIGLIALLLSMYSGLTGYLLIWNQRAYWATKVFATFPTYMDQFPLMGDFYQPLVKSVHMGWNTAEFLLGGGAAITQETITRFFSLHLAFSLIPLIFVELYFYKTGYRRIALNWTKRTIVTMMLVVVAIVLPAAIGARSNPEVTPLPILSDWYFLGLYQMYKYLEPVVATEITMLIPLSVFILPFVDVAITGPEKDIWKRPLILMISIMAFINWIVFSLLIIKGVANIHNDPPYWRDFLYLMINIGMVWQLSMMLNLKDPIQRLKSVGGAMAMGWTCVIQTVFAVWYYYMARTEMFLSPILQGFCYWCMRPFMPDAGGIEDMVRKAHAGALIPQYDYPSYQELLATGTNIPHKADIQQLAQAVKQSSILDPIFQAIPTFIKNPQWIVDNMATIKQHLVVPPLTPAPDLVAFAEHPGVYGWTTSAGSVSLQSQLPDLSYHGLADYVVTNKWCWDYVNFCDRFNGVIKPYPMDVPPLDWGWMVGGFLVMILCFWAAWKFKNTPQPVKATPPEAKEVAAVK